MVDPNNPQHPTPGVAACDRLVAQTEAQERRQAQRPDVTRIMQAAMAMMQLQSQQIAILAQKFMNDKKS